MAPSLLRHAKIASAILISFVASVANAADNYLGIDNTKLRQGNVGFDDVPAMIISVTNFLLGLTGSIAVAAIIYGAVRIAIGSVPGDKDSGKKIIQWAIIGFVIALFSWMIINAVIANF